LLAITSDGLKLTETLEQAGHDVTTETLAPLTPEEQATLYDLLAKVI
jgi:DNA-binding MarR family transcriptional regulator